MGAAIGTDDKGSVNVELNIIPFIDLLSCLTAFLLVTAVWVNVSQLDIRVGGTARDQVIVPTDDPVLSVLVEADGIWVGVSRLEEYERIPNTAAGPDWPKLAASLRAHKTSALFARTDHMEVAAESTPASPIPYRTLVATLDTALAAGFADVVLAEPRGLAARPRL